MISRTGQIVNEQQKVRALETLARGKKLDARQREALSSLGIETRAPGRVAREREWTDGSRTLLWRLLSRGWSIVAIAAFCLRTPESVAGEVVRCGWRERFPGAFAGLRTRRRQAGGNRGRRRNIPA